MYPMLTYRSPDTVYIKNHLIRYGTPYKENEHIGFSETGNFESNSNIRGRFVSIFADDKEIAWYFTYGVHSKDKTGPFGSRESATASAEEYLIKYILKSLDKNGYK